MLAKNWTPEFKKKALSFYYDMNKARIEFSSHAVGRVLDRVISQVLMSSDEVKAMMNSSPKFVQADGRMLYSKKNVYLIRDAITGDIVSVVVRKAPKPEWRELNE